MPLYTIKNTKTDEETNAFMSYEELQDLLKEGSFVQIIKPIKIVQGVGGVLSKTDDGWKEVLKKIKKGAGKRSTVRT